MTTVEIILTDFKQALLRYVRRYISEEETAKDIHQEILIKIFTNYKSLKNQKGIKPWIYQIARNTITDYYRKKKIPLSELPEIVAAESVINSGEDELLPCIKPFIKRLRPNYRQALVFTELQKHSQKELAERMNLSYSGAKSTVQRARQQLHELFRQCCEVEADRYGSIMSVKPRNNCAC